MQCKFAAKNLRQSTLGALLLSLLTLSQTHCKTRQTSEPATAVASSQGGKGNVLTLQQIDKFKIARVDLQQSSVQLDIYQSLGPQAQMRGVPAWARENNLAVAVNASFFDFVPQKGVVPMGPTAQKGYVFESYLDKEIDREKYGVLACEKMRDGNDCHLWNLDNYEAAIKDRITQGKAPFDFAVTGMSWAVQGGEVHPKGNGIPTVRTVVGLSADRKVLFLINGLGSYLNVASVAREVGAFDAINFDGGGSAQLVFQKQVFPAFPGPSEEVKTPEAWEAGFRGVPVVLGIRVVPSR